MHTQLVTNQRALRRLRRQWAGVTAVSLLLWLLLGAWLRQVWPAYAARWLLLSAAALAYSLGVVWRHLSQNRRPHEAQLLPALGWGNGLTLLRGLLVSLLAGFLFSPWPQGALAWLPVLLYTTADIADFLDGYVARITNHATQLGAQLDMEFDGLGMLIVSVLAVWYGQLPGWYLLLGLARYLFVAGIWLRRRRGLPVKALPPSAHRRLFAGFQMGFMSAVLWPILPPAGATIAGTLFALPTALGFGRDWLVVSGRIKPNAPAYQRGQRRVVRAARVWLPLLLRAALPVCVVWMLRTVENWIRPLPWEALLQSWGVPLWLAAALTLLLGGAALVGTLLALAGAAGRLASLALVFPLGFDIASQGVSWANGVALGSAICLMLLGTGPASLWPVEEPYVLEVRGSAPP